MYKSKEIHWKSVKESLGNVLNNNYKSKEGKYKIKGLT